MAKPSDREIESAIEIDRVECPACYQRGYRELDCTTCGGLNWVDVCNINDIVYEDLVDRYVDGNCAPNYLNTGIYCVLNYENGIDTFLIREDRTVAEVTEQADALWLKNYKHSNHKRWGFWAFVRWTRQMMRGAL